MDIDEDHLGMCDPPDIEGDEFSKNSSQCSFDIGVIDSSNESDESIGRWNNRVRQYSDWCRCDWVLHQKSSSNEWFASNVRIGSKVCHETCEIFKIYVFHWQLQTYPRGYYEWIIFLSDWGKLRRTPIAGKIFSIKTRRQIDAIKQRCIALR